MNRSIAAKLKHFWVIVGFKLHLAAALEPSCLPLLFANDFPSLDGHAVNQETYTRDRQLFGESFSYEAILGQEFLINLLSLKADQIWLEVGPAWMKAVYEYILFRGEKSARIITLDQTVPDNLEYLKEIQALQGPSRFRPIIAPAEDADALPENSVDQLSDVYAATTYSRRPDMVIRNYLKWAKIGAPIHIGVSSFSFLKPLRPPEKPRLLDLFRAGPRPSTNQVLEEFFAGIHGAQVRVSIPKKLLPDAPMVITLKKLQRDFSVPELQEIEFQEGYPPVRRYILSGRNLKL